MSDEENFRTTLVYMKSPEVSRRSKFQDELHRAVARSVAKQSTVEENYFSDFDYDPSDSGTNSKSSEKKLPTLKELVQDNNEENTMDEMNTKRKGQSSQEGADANSWQSSNLKLNQCMVQCATDHVIKHLQKNYLKPKGKDQTEMMQNEGKIQTVESFGKSLSKRPLHSRTQTLYRLSIGKSPCPRTTESRYLGTLKILDTKSSRNATFSLETADTIRASIYQVWLEKKMQVLHEEQTKQKLKEQQENERREQAFEKWKEEKDTCQTGKLKKQKEIEKEKRRKEKGQVIEKKKENVAALIKWNTKKEVVLKQKMKENAKEEQKKKTEEEYTKFEKEEIASKMYEKWLEQKQTQEKHDRKQQKIRCILQYDEPPPPWSPPNKTIPFGK
ncbi:uncharacterized protein LOC144493158 isoform X2 [Mustelus asterias]